MKMTREDSRQIGNNKRENHMEKQSSKKIRLIAVDLDGTLFNSNHRVSKVTEEVLKQTLSSGVQVIIATGRNQNYVNDLLHTLDIDIPHISSGGSIILSGRDGEILNARTLQLNGRLSEVITWAEINTIGLVAEFPDGHMRWYASPDFLEQLPQGLSEELSSTDRTQQPLKDYAEPILKISIMQMGETGFGAEDLQQFFPGMHFVYSGYNCLDLTAVGVDKGSALARFAEQYGYHPDEVAAIGDQTNDISMMNYAALSYAMGGAPEEVKTAANFVAPGNDDDGAAWAMRQILAYNRQL